jgi:hypothetical protein
MKMKALRKVARFIKDDINKDIEVIKEVGSGKYRSKYTLKQFLDIRWMVGNGGVWLLFLVLLLAFCSGYWFASQRYQEACNEFIVDNFYNHSGSEYYGLEGVYGLPYNVSRGVSVGVFDGT